MDKGPKARNKAIYFIAILVGVGFVYPLIMTGIFKFNFKASMIIGVIFGVVGAVLWLVTSNIRERRNAAKNTPTI
jgi:hypothetical protein